MAERSDGASARSLLARLVAFPTIAGQSNEDLVAWIASHLADADADVRELQGTRADARNLHAVIGPRDTPGVLLAAHTDVVAVDGQAWTSDPFTLREDGGRLYGRGTADMKGFIAAVLAVAPEAARLGLRRPLHLALSSDEELGCRGVGPLLDELEGLAAPPAWCVVGEPTGMRVAERHKGKVVLRFDVHGRSCHASRAPEGVNAVEYAARLIVGLRELQASLRDELVDREFGIPFATLSVGPITGGVSVNIVPDRCAFECELRFMPGQDPGPLVGRMEALAHGLEDEMRATSAQARIDVARTASYPALAAASAGAAARVAALAGTEAGASVDFGTEAGLYQEALGVPVVVCGPGDIAQAHRPDEYLEAAQLDRAERFALRLVHALATDMMIT
jgi:acetylornithine deacetylase